MALWHLAFTAQQRVRHILKWGISCSRLDKAPGLCLHLCVSISKYCCSLNLYLMCFIMSFDDSFVLMVYSVYFILIYFMSLFLFLLLYIVILIILTHYYIARLTIFFIILYFSIKYVLIQLYGNSCSFHRLSLNNVPLRVGITRIIHSCINDPGCRRASCDG